MSAEELSQLQREDRLLDGPAGDPRLHGLPCARPRPSDSDMITAAYHDDGIDEHGNAINPGPKYAEWINPVHAAGSQNHLHNITTHTCRDRRRHRPRRELCPRHAARPRRSNGAIHQWPVHRPARERDGCGGSRCALDGRSDDLGRRIRPASSDVHRAGLPKGTRDRRDLSYRAPPPAGDACSRAVVTRRHARVVRVAPC